jgi:hypothetical protein
MSMSKIENALAQGFQEADPAELANVEGGFLLALVVIACVIVGCEGKAR